MLTTYYANNYTFAELFQNNTQVQNAWNQNGATTDMANDTYSAVGDGTSSINDPNKIYGTQTYNGNSFTQQTQIAAACYLIYMQNSSSDPATAQRYFQAYSDTLHFSTNVQSKTSNTSTAVNPMSSTAVYGTVDGTDPSEVVRLEHEQLHAIGRSLVGEPSPGGAGPGENNGALLITEEDRARAHQLVQALHREWAEKNSVEGDCLFEGSCSAEIGQAHATVELVRATGAGSWTAEKVNVTLPAFDFHLDDAGWDGVAAEEVRRRLPQVHFLRGMLQTALVDALRPVLAAATVVAMPSPA